MREPPTPEEFKIASSETAKYRHLTEQFCYREDGTPGCGIDIASQGDSVVPWAMALDLPEPEFSVYCSGHPAKGPIQLRGHADRLPFDSESLDFVYSSHLLEDYLTWMPVLAEWVRVLKKGGHLIVIVPDKTLWNEALAKGQSPNCSHQHESEVGELSSYAEPLKLGVIMDRLTAVVPEDYSILFVAKKL